MMLAILTHWGTFGRHRLVCPEGQRANLQRSQKAKLQSKPGLAHNV